MLVFDTETTGLPIKQWGLPYDVKNPLMFQNARLVSIAWNFDGKTTVRLVKPEGFIVPLEATKIHGISNEVALRDGSLLEDVLNEFENILKNANLVIAHNLNFDKAIIDSEMWRLKKQELNWPSEYCTMIQGTVKLGLVKWPKLPELYKILSGNSADDELLHTAAYDMEICLKCFNLLNL